MQNFREIKNKIESIKPVLRDKYHVSSIGIFGSVLREDFQDGKAMLISWLIFLNL
jgi:predicted nucleotidyltransferase